MSGRPSPRPGLSGRGRMPRPSSLTTTVSAPSTQPGAHVHGAVAVGIGVHDDVGARLGDRQLDVGQRVVGHVKGVAKPAEGMPNDGHVLGAGRQNQLEVGRQKAPGGGRAGASQPRVCHRLDMPTRSSSYSRLTADGREAP